MKKQFYRMLFIALLALMQTTWVQAQVNNEVKKVPPGAPRNVIVGENKDGFDLSSKIFKNNRKTKHPRRGGIDNEGEYKLIVKAICDDSKYRSCGVEAFNEKEYLEFDYDYENDEFVFPTDGGTYDVIVKFYSFNSIFSPVNMYYVIKENITVNGDMTIEVNQAEATNKVEFKTVLANGEEARTPHCDPNQLDENGMWAILDNGNASTICTNLAISKKDFICSRHSDTEQWTIDNPVRQSTMYVNDVSENYTFTLYQFILGHDRNVSTTCYEFYGGQNAVFQNDPKDFNVYEMNFTQTKKGKETLDGWYGYYKYEFGSKEGIGGTEIVSTVKKDDETTKVYFGKAPNNKEFGLWATTNFGVLDYESKEIIGAGKEWEHEVINRNYVVGQPIVQENGLTKRMCNGMATALNGNGFEIYKDESAEEGVGFFDSYEENPVLCYSPEMIKGAQGDNIPIIAHRMYSYWDNYYEANMTMMDTYYLGRYGEMSQTDPKVSGMNVKLNGETIIDSENIISAWQEEYELSGVIDITMTNQNRKIDGLQGQNLATIHYDRDQEDATAPVLQMLHFKDGEGYITDRFETSEGALMELFAGDYNEGISESNWLYFDRAKAKTVTVAYAPYGKDNWTDLTLEENPEYYSNLMGWYYAASLDDVTGAAEKGWFDLKIRLEDEAGNWQEQVISPAFQIKSLVDTGISQLTIDNGQLTIPGNENVYDLMGRCIGNAPSSTDKGIRIVRKANGDFRKVVLR